MTNNGINSVGLEALAEINAVLLSGSSPADIRFPSPTRALHQGLLRRHGGLGSSKVVEARPGLVAEPIRIAARLLSTEAGG